MEIQGISGQSFSLALASPRGINEARQIGSQSSSSLEIVDHQMGNYTVQGSLDKDTARIELLFQGKDE